MLDKVHVQGYKSLNDVTVELGRLNVFVGANGSGKTNLLEAIGLLGCAAAGGVDDGALADRGVRPGLPILYKTAFRGQRVRRVISLDCQGGDAAYRVTLDNPIKDPEKAWRIANEAVTAKGTIIASQGPGSATILEALGDKRRRSLKLDTYAAIAPLARATFPDSRAVPLLDALTNFGIYTPFTPMLRGTTQDLTQRSPRPTGLMGGRLAEAVLETMKTPRGRDHLRQVYQLVDWVSGFRSGSAREANLSPSVASTRNVLRFTDRYMTDKRNVLSAFDASEGALYVMFLLTLIGHPTTPPVAAVDNVDQALNPRLARELARTVEAIVLSDPKAPQLLLTGHNPQLLDGLNLRDDRVRLFVVARDAHGATTIKRITVTDAMHAKMEAAGRPLSQLWTEGWLGGMPNL